jgi:hypothetical protein
MGLANACPFCSCLFKVNRRPETFPGRAAVRFTLKADPRRTASTTAMAMTARSARCSIGGRDGSRPRRGHGH